MNLSLRHHRDHHDNPPPPGRGNLDVPLSVWAEDGRTDLLQGLFTDLTRLGDCVAVAGMTASEIPTRTGRRLAAFADRDESAIIRSVVGGDPMGEVHTTDDLACRLATVRGRYDLFTATTTWTQGKSAWQAITRAVTAGGYVAVVVTSHNPRVHARVHHGATSTGLTYVQHIAAVPTSELDHAANCAPDPDGATRVRWQRRVHRDVFIYLRGEAIDA